MKLKLKGILLVKLNNKGQSLVLFVICIPLLVLVILLVFKLGNISSVKKELCNITYEAVYYGLDNVSDNEIKSLILKNNSNISDIEISNNPLKVKTSIKINNSLIEKLDINEITCIYQGNINDNKKIIERVK